MDNLPKIRWMVLVAVAAYGLRLAGIPDEWTASVSAGLLALAKLLTELAVKIDEEDPMYYTMDSGRSVHSPGLWERIW